MLNTFTTIRHSIPLEFKLAAAEEFAQLFNPALQYGSADGEFFYTGDRTAFHGYLVGKYVAVNANRLKGAKPKAMLMSINEPSIGNELKPCDSYSELAKKVAMLEDAVSHLTNATAASITNSMRFGG